jgi:hypothetical protein
LCTPAAITSQTTATPRDLHAVTKDGSENQPTFMANIDLRHLLHQDVACIQLESFHTTPGFKASILEKQASDGSKAQLKYSIYKDVIGGKDGVNG